MNALLHKNNLSAKTVMFDAQATPIVQTKLTVNAPGDVYEQEADAMADRVMRISSNEAAKPVAGLIGKSLQRKCAHCEEEDKKKKPIMRKAEAGNAGMAVSSSFASSLNASKGGGSSLPDGTRSFMENAFSADFSNIKIHTDSRAAEMSDSISASAFTYGNDIYFNKNQYFPNNESGKRLLAHELTHTVQQDKGLNNHNIQRQISLANYHSTVISIRWNDDSSVFFRRLVYLTSRSRNFRDVPISALWQNFHPVVTNFHRNYSRNHASIRNGETIQLNIAANYTANRDIVATNVSIETPLTVSVGPVVIDHSESTVTTPPAVAPASPVPQQVTTSGTPIVVTAIDDIDSVGWVESFATIGEINFIDLNSMVDNILSNIGSRPMSRLNIQVHGNTTTLHIGNTAIDSSNIATYEPVLARLHGHFTSSGFVHLRACYVGNSLPLITELARIFGVPVFAATGTQRNLIVPFNMGDYVSCEPTGTCNMNATRP